MSISERFKEILDHIAEEVLAPPTFSAVRFPIYVCIHMPIPNELTICLSDTRVHLWDSAMAKISSGWRRGTS